jgi:hypothetical protein
MDPKDAPPRTGARERTQAHLRKLVATAAATGLALQGCGSHDPGYGVVDPMPEPSRCAGTAALFRVTAQYKTVSLSRLVEVVIVAPPDVKVGDITVTEGRIVDLKSDGTTYTALVDPTGTGYASIALPVTCKAGPGTAVFRVGPDAATPEKLIAQASDQP